MKKVAITGHLNGLGKALFQRLPNAIGFDIVGGWDSYDITKITGLAVAITSLTSGLTGTPVDGDMHLWSFTDN